MLQQLGAMLTQTQRLRGSVQDVDWTALPERCWVLVFEHLTNQQRAMARLVSQRFRKLGALTHSDAQQVLPSSCSCPALAKGAAGIPAAWQLLAGSQPVRKRPS